MYKIQLSIISKTPVSFQSETYSSNVNISGSNSKCCGSIEYRDTAHGFFKFKTIIDINCLNCYDNALIADVTIHPKKLYSRIKT